MEDIKNIEDIKKIVGCCEQWPNCEGHMDSHEEIFAKQVIENLLKEVEPKKEDLERSEYLKLKSKYEGS